MLFHIAKSIYKDAILRYQVCVRILFYAKNNDESSPPIRNELRFKFLKSHDEHVTTVSASLRGLTYKAFSTKIAKKQERT